MDFCKTVYSFLQSCLLCVHDHSCSFKYFLLFRKRSNYSKHSFKLVTSYFWNPQTNRLHHFQTQKVKIIRYFTNFLNYWNWIILILVFIYQYFALANTLDKEISKPFGLIILMAVFYKGLTILRIFDVLASIIGIFNTIICKPN